MDELVEEVRGEVMDFDKGKAYLLKYKVEKRDLENYLKFIEWMAGDIDELILWRIDSGGDVYNCLKALVSKEKINSALIPMMIGTIKEASIGYFLSDRGVFHVNKVCTPGGLELVSGSGTIGVQEGEIMLHIHVVIADHSGNAYGGHLYSGTIVKEYVEGFMLKLKGVRMERVWTEKIKAYRLKFFKQRLKS